MLTASANDFADIADLKFHVPTHFQGDGIIGCMVWRRGTRSFSQRLAAAGCRSYGDLNNRSVEEVLSLVPTTRRNFDNVLDCLQGAGVRLA